MALCFAKISVAALLLRLIGPNTKWRKWFLYAVSILSFIFSVVTSIITFTQCDPPRALWEKVPGSHCANPHIQTNLSVFLGCKPLASRLCLANADEIDRLEFRCRYEFGLVAHHSNMEPEAETREEDWTVCALGLRCFVSHRS